MMETDYKKLCGKLKLEELSMIPQRHPRNKKFQVAKNYFLDGFSLYKCSLIHDVTKERIRQIVSAQFRYVLRKQIV